MTQLGLIYGKSYDQGPNDLQVTGALSTLLSCHIPAIFMETLNVASKFSDLRFPMWVRSIGREIWEWVGAAAIKNLVSNRQV